MNVKIFYKRLYQNFYYKSPIERLIIDVMHTYTYRCNTNIKDIKFKTFSLLCHQNLIVLFNCAIITNY